MKLSLRLNGSSRPIDTRRSQSRSILASRTQTLLFEIFNETNKRRPCCASFVGADLARRHPEVSPSFPNGRKRLKNLANISENAKVFQTKLGITTPGRLQKIAEILNVWLRWIRWQLAVAFYKSSLDALATCCCRAL